MRATVAVLIVLMASCTSTTSNVTSAQTTAVAKGNFVEGKDYVLLERVRFMDNQGFQQPAEAFSILLPKGWTHQGEVKWEDGTRCRGEMVTGQWSAASPDGAIRVASLPLRTWGWASDPQMQQIMTMQARQGGCGAAGPATAEQYLRQSFAPQELQGATIVEVKDNEAARRELDSQAQRSAAQRGVAGQFQNGAVTARLRWSDNTEGIAMVSVINMILTVPNAYTGAMQQLTTSVSAERSYMRFPAARKDEAERILATVKASYRTNPAWKQAVDTFFARMANQQEIVNRQRIAAIDAQTQANTAAHNQRMNDIQEQGAANTANFNQRMATMDTQMRSWESQQAGQDRTQTAFIKTIREVETYNDGNGVVELSSGYNQAWSRGDGTYILSNSPSFDPRAALQDQNWQEMKPTR